MEDIISTIVRYKRVLIVVGVVLLAGCIAAGVVSYRSSQPLKLKDTNLKTASSDVRQKAADQMSIPIKNMPAVIDQPTTKYMENQLAFILRQKYGPAATSLTAVVRQAIGYDAAGGYSMYVDIPGENETYIGYVNLQNSIGTFVCAPQDQQMDPSKSHCFSIPAVDDNNFPNG